MGLLTVGTWDPLRPGEAVARDRSHVGAEDLKPVGPIHRFEPTSLLLPFCYHYGMSKQIAVRLPEELVDFVDEIVDSGTERSRAAVVTRALERERRRGLAERDARILARTGPDPELAGLAEYAAGLPRDLA